MERKGRERGTRPKTLPFLPSARGLEKGSAAPIQLPSAGIDKGRGFPKGNIEGYEELSLGNQFLN